MSLALMFPGQGSQALGMGVDLSVAEPVVAETFAQASEALGYDLLRICAEGPADLLARTDVTQPALLTVSVGVLRVLRRDGVKSAASFGHSLGEYSALVSSGVLSFEDALRLVQRRGEEMQVAAEAHPGGMVAVIGLEDEDIEALCAEMDGVWLANYNSPGQVVVSGSVPALQQLSAKAKAAGAKRVIPLAVGGAFHSPLMNRALEPLEKELKRATWHAPESLFYSTCTLSFETHGFVELLMRQLVSSVRFTQSVERLYAAGYDELLEVGAGGVLSGLVRRIAPGAVVARVSDVATLASLRKDGRYLEGQ